MGVVSSCTSKISLLKNILLSWIPLPSVLPLKGLSQLSPKQANVCPPEVQASSSAHPPPYPSNNLCHFMIASLTSCVRNLPDCFLCAFSYFQQTSGKSTVRSRASYCETFPGFLQNISPNLSGSCQHWSCSPRD